MSLADPLPCPHDRRPGTMVCLHCRHAQRIAARERRVRLFGQLLLGAVTLTVLGAAGAAGATAFSERRIAAARQPQQPIASAQPAAIIISAPPVTTPEPVDSIATLTPWDSTARPALDSAAPLVPIVPEGKSELADSVFAVRTGDTVRVHFDVAVARTRRSDKFERIVRATLPAIYGKAVDSLLAAVPDGKLVNSAGLLSKLPTLGLQVPLGAGWTLGLWPETRIGRDGPLIVSYRTFIAR